jgi:hypothetical protein
VGKYDSIKAEFSLGVFVCPALTPKISCIVESLILEKEIQTRWAGSSHQLDQFHGRMVN